MNNIHATADALSEHLKQLVADADELLSATVATAASNSDSKLHDARRRLDATLRSAKSRLQDAQDTVIDQAKVATEATDTYVREHPWQSVGIGAAAGAIVGVLVGLLAARR